jgi:hypothetical protein
MVAASATCSTAFWIRGSGPSTQLVTEYDPAAGAETLARHPPAPPLAV